MSARLLYEDDAVIAVDKPAGTASIRERDVSAPCLHVELERARGERLFVVHRLDKEVSGVILFARTAAAHRALSMSFEAREVDKRYHAIVDGALEGERAVTLSLREFGSGRVGADALRGKPCETRVSLVAQGGGVSLVDAQPITGRRHQIRAHLYAIGHPILGDRRYGDGARAATEPRLFLHARELSVPHPTTRERLKVSCAAPEAFSERLR
ncbi:MAG: RluA family pseudouridine synthase [Polyangiaceae bacterium]|nr:RluA family pseudouridine synthase [Polyangiaceae bacterium]